MKTRCKQSDVCRFASETSTIHQLFNLLPLIPVAVIRGTVIRILQPEVDIRMQKTLLKRIIIVARHDTTYKLKRKPNLGQVFEQILVVLVSFEILPKGINTASPHRTQRLTSRSIRLSTCTLIALTSG